MEIHTEVLRCKNANTANAAFAGIWFFLWKPGFVIQYAEPGERAEMPLDQGRSPEASVFKERAIVFL